MVMERNEDGACFWELDQVSIVECLSRGLPCQIEALFRVRVRPSLEDQNATEVHDCPHPEKQHPPQPFPNLGQ